MKLLWDPFGQFYEAWYSPDRSWSGYISEDSSRYSGFLVIGLLYYYAQGFLYLRYSGILLHSHDVSSIIQYYSKDLYSQKCKDDYCSVDLRALPIVFHILIGINSTVVPFVFNLPLNEIARTQFFVRWVDCNTPFPEYVLSCVSRFSVVFFRFVSCICFAL